MLFSKASYTLIVGCAFALLPASALSNDMKVSGFLGFGGVYSSHNNFLGTNNKNHEIIDMGLQGYYDISNYLSFSGQISYRRLGDLMNDSRPRLDYGALTWSIPSASETSVSIGRIKPQVGLYNTTRDTPMSRPTIIMPQSIYSDFYRDLLLSFDGARIGTNVSLDKGTVMLEAVYGDSNLDEDFNFAIVGDLSTGRWKSNSGFTADMRYSNHNTQLSFSFNRVEPAYITSNNSVIDVTGTGVFIPLISGQLSIDSYHLGAKFNTGNWEYGAELLRRKNQIEGIIPLDKSTSEGYFAQIRYTIASSLTATLRYEQYYRNKEGENGGATDLSLVPSHANRSKTSTMALTWQATPQWMLAIDTHFVEGAGWLAPFTTTTQLAFGKKHWRLIAAQAIYRF